MTQGGHTPKVSVVMSVYNGSPYLREAIDSILQQTYEDFEFLIIDDGSTDGSRDVISSYDDPRIELLENDINQGLPASLNRGIASARGEYIARQDADDISLPDRLQRQVHWLDTDNSTGVVGTWTLEMDIRGRVFNSLQFADDRQLLLQRMVEEGLNPWPHGSSMMRKKLVDAVGGYDERFWYTQDFDLWLRLWPNCDFRVLPWFLYKLRRVPVETRFKQRCQRNYFYWAVRQFREEKRVEFQDVRECVRRDFPETTMRSSIYKARYWARLASTALHNRLWGLSFIYAVTILKVVNLRLAIRALSKRGVMNE